MRHTVSERGFKYCEDIVCTYGSTVRVYESSAASGPHIWLNVKVNPANLTRQEYGEGTAHLTLEQARELRAQLDFLIENHYQEDKSE